MKKFILLVIPCCILLVSCSNNQNLNKDDPKYILEQRRKDYLEMNKVEEKEEKTVTYQERNEELISEIRKKIN